MNELQRTDSVRLALFNAIERRAYRLMGMDVLMGAWIFQNLRESIDQHMAEYHRLNTKQQETFRALLDEWQGEYSELLEACRRLA